MQQTQGQNFHNPRLSTSSYSSLSATTTALLNGLLPSPRFSQASTNGPTSAANLTSNQLHALQRSNNRLKRSERLKRAGFIVILTLILAVLFLITIELATRLVKIQSEEHLFIFSNLTTTNNETNSTEKTIYPIRAFFTCVWIFNAFLLIYCFIIHSITIQRRSRRGRTTAVFLR
jgi:amino acid transporter